MSQAIPSYRSNFVATVLLALYMLACVFGILARRVARLLARTSLPSISCRARGCQRAKRAPGVGVIPHNIGVCAIVRIRAALDIEAILCHAIQVGEADVPLCPNDTPTSQ